MKKILVLLSAFCLGITSFSQNVGINNLSPQVPLDILKTGGGHLVRLVNPSSATGAAAGLLFTNSASYNPPGFSSASIIAQRKTLGGQDLIFSTSQTNGAALERMRIDTTGNVLINDGRIGVGTLNPGYSLHLYTNNPSIGFYDEDDAAFSGSIAADSIDLVLNAYRKPVGFTNPAGNIIMQVNQTGFLGTVATPGWVGIGTAEPTAKLHVSSNVMIGSGSPASGYLLSVNGKIMSEEVRVELDGDWPDYVFDKGYRLPSLLQVEKYIKTNKHLPNIPSAKKVEAEGFDLGDMNKRLLEKVEELTLYLIEQNKQLIAIKKELEEIKAKENHSSIKQ
jgi:hypothetical protein